jgi:hypothetical protein
MQGHHALSALLGTLALAFAPAVVQAEGQLERSLQIQIGEGYQPSVASDSPKNGDLAMTPSVDDMKSPAAVAAGRAKRSVASKPGGQDANEGFLRFRDYRIRTPDGMEILP